MMSAVALILFFLMLLSYIQNLITGNNLQNTRELLEDTEVRLADTELELKETEDSLALTLKEVEDAEEQLSKVTIDLDAAKLTLAEKEDDLKAQDKLLSDQAALLQDQEEYMKAASEEIMALRAALPEETELKWNVALGGESFASTTKELTLPEGTSAEEAGERLAYLPDMRMVDTTNAHYDASELAALRERYP
jgi:chemotaxis protein MotB